MALTKDVQIDSIQVLPDGTLQIRQATTVRDDGVVVGAPSYWRVAVGPGEPLPPEADARVRAVAQAVWTPEVVAAHRARMAALRDRPLG